MKTMQHAFVCSGGERPVLCDNPKHVLG